MADVIMQVLISWSAGKTCCCSGIARSFDNDWRPLMPTIRDVGTLIAEEGWLGRAGSSSCKSAIRFIAKLLRGPIRPGFSQDPG
ncbi:MAG: DUF3253 domain-containing protein [Paracoccaceae bacterium]